MAIPPVNMAHGAYLSTKTRTKYLAVLNGLNNSANVQHGKFQRAVDAFRRHKVAGGCVPFDRISVYSDNRLFELDNDWSLALRAHPHAVVLFGTPCSQPFHMCQIPHNSVNNTRWTWTLIAVKFAEPMRDGDLAKLGVAGVTHHWDRCTFLVWVPWPTVFGDPVSQSFSQQVRRMVANIDLNGPVHPESACTPPRSPVYHEVDGRRCCPFCETHFDRNRASMLMACGHVVCADCFANNWGVFIIRSTLDKNLCSLPKCPACHAAIQPTLSRALCLL
jgi:hypothetical protein